MNSTRTASQHVAGAVDVSMFQSFLHGFFHCGTHKLLTLSRSDCCVSPEVYTMKTPISVAAKS